MEYKYSTDVWFCSYLMSLGYQVKSFDKLSQGKGKFHFEISDEEWKRLKLDFNNSDIIKIKSFISQLKDLLY